MDPDSSASASSSFSFGRVLGSRRPRFFLVWGLTLLGVLALFRAVLLPFFLAIVLAYVFEPVVARMTRPRAGRALPRWSAVLILYFGIVAGLASLLVVGIPQLVREVQALAVEVPAQAAEFRESTLPQIEERLRRAVGAPRVADGAAGAAVPAPLVERSLRIVPLPDGSYEVRLPTAGVLVEEEEGRYVVRTRPRPAGDEADELGRVVETLVERVREDPAAVWGMARAAVSSVVRPIFTFFIVLMLSAYVLITKDAILGFFRLLVDPSRRERFDSLLHRIDRGLSGVVRGQLAICVVNGALSGIGFYALGLKYWWLLTIIATVFSIIPIFGAIVSSIPAVVIGFQLSFGTAVLTLGWILLIHQIEANLLNPKILGDAARVHPVLVVFALLSGEHLFGIAGALLAVPVLSITQSIFLHDREHALGIAAPKADRTRG